MTTLFTMFRDGSEIRWVFDPVPGLEMFGRTVASGRVVIDGKLAGEVAQDWLRDQGLEPKRTNKW